MTEPPVNASDQKTDAPITNVNRLGWRQLSVLPTELAEYARQLAPEPLEIEPDDLVVVASHDCDVCSRSEMTEPMVELLAVTVLARDKLDGNVSHLKSPRVLEFRSTLNDSDLHCRARAHRRWWIPRRELLRDPPAGQLVPDPTDLVARWLGRRYDRSALPDAFNDRIRPVDDAIEKAAAQHGDLITGFYVTLDTDAELLVGTSYQVSLTAVIRAEDATEGAVRLVQAVVDTLAGHMASCAGIDLLDSLVLTEAEVTMQDLRVLRRLDMETLSYSSEPPGHVAPPT